jgi:hypothetical protein
MSDGSLKKPVCGVGGRGWGFGPHRPPAPGTRRTVLLGLALLFGCSARQPQADLPAIDLLAVLPIERAAAASADGEGDQALPENAGLAVTAQIYRFLAQRPDFRFVADLAVQDAARSATVSGAADLTARAVALGKEVSADAVIFGTVSRFRERVGTELGATGPASVSFDLGLVDVASGKVLWQGRFSKTQEPLSSNLFNFWMFWRAGPHWFSARELAGLGVEDLLEEMTETVRP